MSNKLKKKHKPGSGPPPKDSVFREAWQNMNDDMARFMPDFIARRLQKKEGKLWVMIGVTLLELVLLGVIGKLIYDWLSG